MTRKHNMLYPFPSSTQGVKAVQPPSPAMPFDHDSTDPMATTTMTTTTSAMMTPAAQIKKPSQQRQPSPRFHFRKSASLRSLTSRLPWTKQRGGGEAENSPRFTTTKHMDARAPPPPLPPPSHHSSHQVHLQQYQHRQQGVQGASSSWFSETGQTTMMELENKTKRLSLKNPPPYSVASPTANNNNSSNSNSNGNNIGCPPPPPPPPPTTPAAQRKSIPPPSSAAHGAAPMLRRQVTQPSRGWKTTGSRFHPLSTALCQDVLVGSELEDFDSHHHPVQSTTCGEQPTGFWSLSGHEHPTTQRQEGTTRHHPQPHHQRQKDYQEQPSQPPPPTMPPQRRMLHNSSTTTAMDDVDSINDMEWAVTLSHPPPPPASRIVSYQYEATPVTTNTPILQSQVAAMPPRPSSSALAPTVVHSHGTAPRARYNRSNSSNSSNYNNHGRGGGGHRHRSSSSSNGSSSNGGRGSSNRNKNGGGDDDDDGNDKTIQVEIYTGVFKPLRGAKETSRAAKNHFIQPSKCMACATEMLVIADAAYVICPLCKCISPTSPQSLNETFGVGLGFLPPNEENDIDKTAYQY